MVQNWEKLLGSDKKRGVRSVSFGVLISAVGVQTTDFGSMVQH